MKQNCSCPLCFESASYMMVLGKKYFSCKNCIDFIIEEFAEERLKGYPELCKELSEQSANTGNSEILSIYSAGFQTVIMSDIMKWQPPKWSIELRCNVGVTHNRP